MAQKDSIEKEIEGLNEVLHSVKFSNIAHPVPGPPTQFLAYSTSAKNFSKRMLDCQKVSRIKTTSLVLTLTCTLCVTLVAGLSVRYALYLRVKVLPQKRRRYQKILIELQNDHKRVMREIEESLHELHREARENNPVQTQQSLRPFVKINRVDKTSPAEAAVSKALPTIKGTIFFYIIYRFVRDCKRMISWPSLEQSRLTTSKTCRQLAV